MVKIQRILLLDLLGTGTEYIWEEVKKISNISSEDTEENLTYNLPNIAEKDEYFVEGRKLNWSKLYGKLGSGEYEFILFDENSLTIRIKFTINQDGKIVYEKPTF